MTIESRTFPSSAVSGSPGSAPLAIVYTDIVGSTAMNRSLGDERARELMHVHDGIIRAALVKHSGTEMQPTGDGFKVVFSNAADAVRATVEMQSIFAKRSSGRETQLEVRIGVHFGAVLYEDSDIYGESVIIAARVMARAGACQILVTEAVCNAAGELGQLEYVNCGRYHLKGFDEGIRLFEVTWPGMSSGRVHAGAVSVELPRRWQGTSFVGRFDELRTLEECLESAESGVSRVALLAGEAGIGKSRLAFEFIHAFSERIGVVASARCFADLGGPCQPIVDLLMDLRARLPDFPIPEEDAADLAPLGQLAAELHDWFGGPAVSESFVPLEQEQPRLYAALVRLLLRVAQDRTLVLVLDDVQWADDKTLDLLRLLGRQLGPGLGNVQAKLFVVALYREEDRRVRPAFTNALAELERSRMMTRVALARLEEDELRHLLTDLCSGRPSPAFTSYVQNRSGGNPYFAEEIATDAIERSELHPADPNWRRPSEDESGVPPGISALLEQRISSLSPTSLDILQTAELLGTRFALEELQQSCESSAEQVIQAIDDGYVAGLLFEEPGSGGYSFHHSLVAEVLDASQSPSKRRARHGRIAEALETAYGDAIGPHLDEIARHLLSAGDRAPADRISHYTSLAGDRAIALHAYPEADRWYSAALEAIAHLPECSAQDRATLEMKRALALGRTGNLEVARDLADSAIRTFSHAKRRDQVAIACEAIASCLVLHARHRDALPYLERALKSASKDARALRGRTLWHYATALDLTGRSDEMRATADEILEIASDLRSPELRERALLIHRNWHANHTTDVAQARTLTRRVLRSAERRGDIWDRTLLLESLGLFELSLVRIDEALEALDRALTLATDVGALAKIIDARGLRALCFAHRGEFERVDEEWERARPLIGQVPGSIHLGQFLWARTRSKLWKGQFVGAPTSPNTAYPGLAQIETAELAVSGMIASEMGSSNARELISAAAKRHAPHGVGLNWMLASQMLAAGWMNLGEVDEAMKWYPGLLPYHRTLSLTFPACELARIAAAAGWWQKSAAHFSTALSVAKREGLKPHYAIARYEQARMWEAQQNPRLRARAERALSEAYEAFEDLEMHGAAERLANLRKPDIVG